MTGCFIKFNKLKEFIKGPYHKKNSEGTHWKEEKREKEV